VCFGAQPQSVSREHYRYLTEGGGTVLWAADVMKQCVSVFQGQLDRLANQGCTIFASFDADAADCADVPGVSAPNAAGLAAIELAECAHLAGACVAVSSFEIAEINPLADRDAQSARWGALMVWQFMAGLSHRASGPRSS
jgi:arginase family enzyme